MQERIRLPDTFRKSASGQTKSTIVSIEPGTNTFNPSGVMPTRTGGGTTTTGGGGYLPPAQYTGENGRLDTSKLTSIGNGHRLETTAARAYLRMVDAARRDGITWSITDSYRTYETQVRLAREKGLYSQGGLAAVPGTSKHGWGFAVDLGGGANNNGTPQNNWLRQNAGRFGFHNIPREPWHWEYRGG